MDRTKKFLIAIGACAALTVAPVAAEAHTFSASSSVTIAPKFSGKVKSGNASCRRGRSVSLWKVRKGPDRKMGSTTSNSAGSWSIKKGGARGRFYAKVAGRSGGGYGHNHRCGAATSRTIRVG